MKESKVNDFSYYQISGWMLNKLNLKGTTLQIYALIYGFSQDGETEFKGSLQYLCDFTGASKPTVISALKKLVAEDLIIKNTEIINGVTFNRYRANLQVVKNLYGGSKDFLLNNIKPFAKSASGGKVINCRCFYCPDSKDQRKGHFYISVPHDEKTPSLFYC